MEVIARHKNQQCVGGVCFCSQTSDFNSIVSSILYVKIKSTNLERKRILL